MIPLLIFGGWSFVVVLACLVGTCKELSLSETTADKLRVSLKVSQGELDLARSKVESALRYFNGIGSIEDNYQRFDEVLANLPVASGNVGHPRQFEIVEREAFDFAAYNVLSEDIPDAVTFTKLAFIAKPLYLSGRECLAWVRNGWMILPEGIFDRPPRQQERDYTKGAR